MIESTRRKWFALALLLGVQFMVVLDIAIVNVALPSIKNDLGFSQENLQWVVSAYALLFGGFLMLFGRVADIVGRRRVFLFGIAIFTIASLASGLAWSEGALIGARAFQGFGAAMITPAALSILTTTFAEGKERNAALGAWGAVGAFGAVAGVLLGGVLTDALGWQWIFFVNVPVGVLGLVLAPILLTESRDARTKSFDVPGGVLPGSAVGRFWPQVRLRSPPASSASRRCPSAAPTSATFSPGFCWSRARSASRSDRSRSPRSPAYRRRRPGSRPGCSTPHSR